MSAQPVPPAPGRGLGEGPRPHPGKEGKDKNRDRSAAKGNDFLISWPVNYQHVRSGAATITSPPCTRGRSWETVFEKLHGVAAVHPLSHVHELLWSELGFSATCSPRSPGCWAGHTSHLSAPPICYSTCAPGLRAPQTPTSCLRTAPPLLPHCACAHITRLGRHPTRALVLGSEHVPIWARMLPGQQRTASVISFA